MTQKNITVYYQKEFNPYTKYTDDQLKNFSKTHTKVFEGTITNVENEEDVFSAFNNDYANPLSYTNETNQVCVIGNSFGLGQSLSCGIVSGKNRRGLGFNQIENFIQTDAAVNPGASGAPLVNEHGQLVGMVDAIYTKEADIDAGVNFAIDKKLIQKFLKTRSGQIN